MEKVNKVLHASTITMALLGLIGNGLVLLTMRNKKFNKMSTSVYLAALAVSDTLALFSASITSLVLPSDMLFSFNLRNYSLSGCIVCEFFAYFSPKMSAWCIVAITVERTIAVLKPHK